MVSAKTKMKEATSAKHPNDASLLQLEELARFSSNFRAFPEMMSVLWSRVNAAGKDWLHIQKALHVLEYLLQHGSTQVVMEAKVHTAEIRTLTSFYHNNAIPDNGSIIRERAHAVMKLLNNEQELEKIRAANRGQ